MSGNKKFLFFFLLFSYNFSQKIFFVFFCTRAVVFVLAIYASTCLSVRVRVFVRPSFLRGRGGEGE